MKEVCICKEKISFAGKDGFCAQCCLPFEPTEKNKECRNCGRPAEKEFCNINCLNTFNGTEKSLRESLRKDFDNAFDLDNYGQSHIVNRKVTEFWLSKFSTLLTEMREEISSKLDKKTYQNSDVLNQVFTFNQGLKIGIDTIDKAIQKIQ